MRLDKDMTDIKETFNTWLTQTNDTLTTASTASEYTGRLNRLSLRLYGKTDWPQLANDIYILRLLFADSRNWIHISDEDLYHITIYLQNYKNQSLCKNVGFAFSYKFSVFFA